jgi:aspartate racemase
MAEKVLGIIGGMGPEATTDFMNRVIRMTPATDDKDHIRMIVDNHPQIPSRIKALFEKNGEDPTVCLVQIARNLEKWGADLVAIPCNTAHYYYQAVQNSVQIPVLNMLDLVVDMIKRNHPGLKNVGFLGSTAVIQTELYEKKLAQHSISIKYPKPGRQDRIMDAIRAIKSGKCSDSELQSVVDTASKLMRSGAEVLIIGCTELSATCQLFPDHIGFYDASQVLAEAVVKEIKGEIATSLSEFIPRL